METYSIISDFGGINPNISQLHQEIIANSNITKILQGINNTGDVIDIVFDLVLSGAEKTELDTLISNHVPIFKIHTDKELCISPSVVTFTGKTFVKIATIIFVGGTYAEAKSISYMDSAVTSYDIQLFNKSNKQVLLTKNLTNTSGETQNLGILTNLSESPIQLEVLIKKNGNSGNSAKVYIENLTIYYK